MLGTPDKMLFSRTLILLALLLLQAVQSNSNRYAAVFGLLLVQSATQESLSPSIVQSNQQDHASTTSSTPVDLVQCSEHDLEHLLLQIHVSVLVRVLHPSGSETFKNEFYSRLINESKNFIVTIDDLADGNNDMATDHHDSHGKLAQTDLEMEHWLSFSWKWYNESNLEWSMLKGQTTLSLMVPLLLSAETDGSDRAVRTKIVTLWEDDIDDSIVMKPPTLLRRRLANIPQTAKGLNTNPNKKKCPGSSTPGPLVQVHLDATTTFTTAESESERGDSSSDVLYPPETNAEGFFGFNGALSVIWMCVTMLSSVAWYRRQTEHSDPHEHVERCSTDNEEIDRGISSQMHGDGDWDENDKENGGNNDDDNYRTLHREKMSYEEDSSNNSECDDECKIYRPPKLVRQSLPHATIPEDLSFMKRSEATQSSSSNCAVWKTAKDDAARMEENHLSGNPGKQGCLDEHESPSSPSQSPNYKQSSLSKEEAKGHIDPIEGYRHAGKSEETKQDDVGESPSPKIAGERMGNSPQSKICVNH